MFHLRKKEHIKKIEDSLAFFIEVIEMARAVFANEDLKRHIFSFGYPEHIEFTKSLTEILKVDSYQFEDRYYENRNDRTIYDYMFEEFTSEELIVWTNYFARCHCCTRHSHDKPRVTKQGFVCTPKIDTTDYGCDCPCRSLGRNCIRVLSHEGI